MILTTIIIVVVLILFYLGIILKNPFEKSIWFNKLSLKRYNVEVAMTSIDNIKNISIKDSIVDYHLYDYVYEADNEIFDRFFPIDYWNYGLLDEDDYDEHVLKISNKIQDFFNESPKGEAYLTQKYYTLNHIDEKIKILNYLFKVYAFKNKLNEFDIFLKSLKETDAKMQIYIEKARLDIKDNGIRRYSGL